MDVLVISGSRADLGSLIPVLKAVEGRLLHLPQRVVGNESEAAHVAGLACQDITYYFADKDKPDWAIILGDRFEILGAATALNLLNIPIAHLSGGDITEGSQDNCMRHAITKLAHVHFPTHQAAADRILQMGEEPWRVKAVGCPGIDGINELKLYDLETTLKKLSVSSPFALVNYQVPTLAHDPIGEAEQLLGSLYELNLPCVFTTVNPDAYSLHIQQLFENFCRSGRGVIMDMGQMLYLSAMKWCYVMVGNSSSGFYEAPTLKTPFVNIGDRQKGRIESENVCTTAAGYPIARALARIRQRDLSKCVNPYGDGMASVRIRDTLQSFRVLTRSKLLRKRWNYGVQSGLGDDSQESALG